MPTPAWDDLSVFVDTDDFAILATFVRVGGQVIPDVAGNFDSPAMLASAGEFTMTTSDARFTCPHAKVATLKKNDTATIDGLAYYLDHDPQPDGTGMAILHLSLDTDDAAPPGGGGGQTNVES